MSGNGVSHALPQTSDPIAEQDELTLDSSLAELTRIAGWVEGLAARYPISSNVAFAMKLCLEEALSNVIRHGYQGREGSRVTVRFRTRDENVFELLVEDDAPQFNPLKLPPLPPISEDPTRSGGQGIRLMRSFADSVEWSATSTGNRLSIRVSNRPQMSGALEL